MDECILGKAFLILRHTFSALRILKSLHGFECRRSTNELVGELGFVLIIAVHLLVSIAVTVYG